MKIPPQGTRVLIVEDEAIIAMTIEDMVEQFGCDVVGTASSLGEALDQVRETEFDIVLLDLNLHGETSIPVATLLRDAGKPFLFTTGYGSILAHTGFADNPVLAKPYRAEHLATMMAQMLG